MPRFLGNLKIGNGKFLGKCKCCRVMVFSLYNKNKKVCFQKRLVENEMSYLMRKGSLPAFSVFSVLHLFTIVYVKSLHLLMQVSILNFSIA